MKIWAWLWVASLALIGWAPALMVSYAVAFMGVAAGWFGPFVFGATYAVILGAGLAMLIQVRNYFGLGGAQSRWFTWGGSGVLVVTWGGALLGFALWAGWI